MKKYLLFIISMLCVSIGTWADIPDGATAIGENGSYWKIENGVATVHIANTSDFSTYCATVESTGIPNDLKTATKIVITTGTGATVSADDGKKFNVFENASVIDLSNADVSPLYSPAGENIQLPKSKPTLIIPSGIDAYNFYYNASNNGSYWAYLWTTVAQKSGDNIDVFVINATANMLTANVVGDAKNITLKNIYGNANALNIQQGQNSEVLNSINSARNNHYEDGRISKLTVINGSLGSDVTFSNTWIHNLDLSGLNANSHTITFNTGSTEDPNTKIESINLTGATNLTDISLKDQSNLSGVNLSDVATVGTLDLTGVPLENLTISANSADVINKIVPETNSSGETIDYTSHIKAPSNDPVEVTVASPVTAESVQAAIDALGADKPEGATPNNVNILHVTGTLTEADINYIKDLPKLELLDISACTYGTDIPGKIGTALRTDTYGESKNIALIVPTPASTDPKVGTAEFATYQAAIDGIGLTFGYFTDDTKKNLHVFTSNHTNSGKYTLLNYKYVVDNTVSLTFLPRYKEDGTFQYYMKQNETYGKDLTTAAVLGQLSAASIDFTWVYYGDEYCDFSELNEATHYIIVQQGSQADKYDFTSGSSTYKYNNNIYIVSTYKGTEAPYATEVKFDGTGYDFSKATGLNRTANITWIRKAGELKNARSFVSEDQKTANQLSFVGTINKLDLEAMGIMGATYFDFSHATFGGTGDDAADFARDFKNTAAKYIALPNNSDKELPTTAAIKTNCSALEGIGTYGTTDKSFVYCAYQENKLSEVLTMTTKAKTGFIEKLIVSGPVTGKDVGNCNYIDERGHVMFTEDTDPTSTSYHQITGKSYDKSTDGKDVISGSLSGYMASSIKLVDFTNVTLPTYPTCEASYQSADGSYQNDLAFGLISLNNAEEIKLPIDHSVWRLPSNSFATYKGKIKVGDTEIPGICIPGNYKEIGGHAFTNSDAGLLLVYTTEVDSDGDADMTQLIANGKIFDTTTSAKEGRTLEQFLKEAKYTITLPPSLTKVEYYAFSNDERITDVYITSPSGASDVAPECEKDAFSSGSTYGWGGFNNVPPITKKCYVSTYEQLEAGLGTSSSETTEQTEAARTKSFAILHWPAGASNDNIKRYTDVTREYHIQDQEQTTDADGNVYAWPNQTDYNRAYSTASNGYLWHGFKDQDSYEPTMSQADADALYTNKIDSVYHAATGQTGFNTALYNKDYRGWHQFVLTGSVKLVEDGVDPDPVWNVSEYNENDWYTICLPFDMNEDDVLNVFGAQANDETGNVTINDKSGTSITLNPGESKMPKIVQLYQVERNPDTKRIVLWFTPSIAEKKDGKYMEWNPAQKQYVECEKDANGKYIIIKAGYPYHIKPYLPKDVTDNPTKYANRTFSYSKKANENTSRDFNSTLGSKVPYKEWIVKGVKTGNDYSTEKEYATGDKNFCDYLFIGTYEDVMPVPMYSYFLASNGTQKVWYYNYWTDKDGKQLYQQPWSANTCIIVPHTEGIGKIDYFRNTSNEAASSYRIFFKEDSSASKIDAKDATMKSDVLYDNSGNELQSAIAMAFGDFNFEDDAETTDIIRIENDGRIVTSDSVNIYTLDGQVVRRNGSLNGLAIGIYIKNGKKIVVK